MWTPLNRAVQCAPRSVDLLIPPESAMQPKVQTCPCAMYKMAPFIGSMARSLIVPLTAAVGRYTVQVMPPSTERCKLKPGVSELKAVTRLGAARSTRILVTKFALSGNRVQLCPASVDLAIAPDG